MNELITKYFEGTLTKSELDVFNAKLVEDERFKQEFTFHSQLKNAIEASERQKIKQQLKHFETLKPNLIIKYLPYAAILVMAIGIWYFMLQKPNTDTLYANNFSAYPNVIEPISRNSSDKNLQQSAYQNYELGNYNQALVYLKQLKNKDATKTHIVNIYMANCYLVLGNPKEAKMILLVNKNVESDWKDKNLWYLALTYLKLHDITNCKATLTQLLALNSSYKKAEARSLLKALN